MNPKFPMMMLSPDGAGGAADPAVNGPGSAPGGPTPSPTPAPAPQPRVPFSVETMGQGTPQDDAPDGSGGAPAGQGAARAPQDNPIPYSRVKQMIDSERQRLMGQFREVMGQVAQRIPKQPDPKQLMRAMGYDVPDDQPRYLTADQVESMLAERTSALEAQFTQRQEIAHANTELARLKAANPDLFDDEGAFEGLVVHTWGAIDGDITEAFAKVKAAVDRAHDRRVKEYADGKRAGAARQPLRPGGGATPTAPAGRKVHDLATVDGQDAALDDLLASDGGI